MRKRLIEERNIRGLTQEQVARALGIRQSTVAELERGSKRPSYAMMVKFAR